MPTRSTGTEPVSEFDDGVPDSPTPIPRSTYGSAICQYELCSFQSRSISRNATDSTQSQLQLSFSSAEDLAASHPSYADQITAAAQSSFLKGDQWGYLAALVAILIGMALVYRFFPRKDEEDALHRAYEAADTEGARAAATAPVAAPRVPPAYDPPQ